MPLAFATISASEKSARVAIFLHGILGQGGNFRGVARRFVEARPEWSAVLVDLRAHGRSLGMSGPDTIRAAAEDIVAIEGNFPGSVEGVVGHSFGGKVALEYVALKSGAIDRAWILDATPGTRPDARGSEMVVDVMQALEALPKTFPARSTFHDALAVKGFDEGIIQWLAMNLARDDAAGTFHLKIDLSRIRALLEDYLVRDLWPVVENPPGRVKIDFMLGEKSPVFSRADRDRLDNVCKVHANRISSVTIPNAGHWVHAEAPDAVIDRLIQTA